MVLAVSAVRAARNLVFSGLTRGLSDCKLRPPLHRHALSAQPQMLPLCLGAQCCTFSLLHSTHAAGALKSRFMQTGCKSLGKSVFETGRLSCGLSGGGGGLLGGNARHGKCGSEPNSFSQTDCTGKSVYDWFETSGLSSGLTCGRVWLESISRQKSSARQESMANHVVLRSGLNSNRFWQENLAQHQCMARHHSIARHHNMSRQRMRPFSSTAFAASQLGMRKAGTTQEEEQGPQQKAAVQDDWALRLANENGFLSWCRNSYLTTVVGIAMMAEGITPLAFQAAEAAFLVAGVNLTWGTYQYVYNLMRLRRRTGMSALGSLTYVCMALLHLSLWFVTCTLFLGYTDDADTVPSLGASGGRSNKGDDV